MLSLLAYNILLLVSALEWSTGRHLDCEKHCHNNDLLKFLLTYLTYLLTYYCRNDLLKFIFGYQPVVENKYERYYGPGRRPLAYFAIGLR